MEKFELNYSLLILLSIGVIIYIIYETFDIDISFGSVKWCINWERDQCWKWLWMWMLIVDGVGWLHKIGLLMEEWWMLSEVKIRNNKWSR